MLQGNQLQKALIEAGVKGKIPKLRKPHHRHFTCTKCNSPMKVIEYTNTMACTNDACDQYYIFNN